MAYTVKDCHIDWWAELAENGTMTINKDQTNMSKFDELKEDLQILNYDLNTTHQAMLEMAFVCDFCKNHHECDKHQSCRINDMDMACEEFKPSEEWEDYCGCQDWWL